MQRVFLLEKGYLNLVSAGLTLAVSQSLAMILLLKKTLVYGLFLCYGKFRYYYEKQRK